MLTVTKTLGCATWAALTVIVTACDFSVAGMVGDKERWPVREPLDSVSVETQPANLRVCRDTPELNYVGGHECTESTASLFDLATGVKKVDVAADGRRLFVRVDAVRENGASPRQLAQLYRFDFRNTQTGDVLRFECAPMMFDTYACTPKCQLKQANRESMDSALCAHFASEVKLTRNAQGQGLFAIYRYAFRHPDCPEAETTYGDLPGETHSGLGYCDDSTHEREVSFGNSAVIPSLDLEVQP